MAVKADDLPGAAAQLPASIGSKTLVMPLVNGIPWWLGSMQDQQDATIALSILMAFWYVVSYLSRSWAAWFILNAWSRAPPPCR
jgi:ketopantoate reductase